MQKIMTTTAQNTKISHNFPARKSPGECTVSADPFGKSPKKSAGTAHKSKTKQKKHWETRRNFPILHNEQIQNVCKNSNFFLRIYCDKN